MSDLVDPPPGPPAGERARADGPARDAAAAAAACDAPETAGLPRPRATSSRADPPPAPRPAASEHTATQPRSGPGPRLAPSVDLRSTLPRDRRFNRHFHPRSRLRARAARSVAAVLIAVVAGGFAPLTDPAQLTVVALGALLIAWALGKPITGLAPPSRRPAPAKLHPRGVAGWVALLLAFTAWELFALFHGPRAAFPTVSFLAAPVLKPRLGRAAAYVLWFGSGVWLARR